MEGDALKIMRSGYYYCQNRFRVYVLLGDPRMAVDN